MERQTIIGVGCVGGRMVNRMVGAGRIEGAFIAINTDRRELEACKASTKMLIGERSAIRLGGRPPYVVMEAAGDAVSGIAHICADKDAVIIVAALGGGAGTGVAPIVARIAKKQGCRVVAVVTKPFEDRDSLAYALVCLKMLKGIDLLLSVPFLDLLQILGSHASLGEVFRAGDAIVAKTVELLPRLLTRPGMEEHHIVDVGAVWAFAEGRRGVTRGPSHSPAGGCLTIARRTSRGAPQGSGTRRKRQVSRVKSSLA
jgi:cell division protein FtsZ